MNFTFAWWPILFLVPVPLLIRFIIKQPKKSQVAPLVNYSLPYFEKVEQTQKKSSHRFAQWLIWLALLIAAARPQWLDNATTPIIRQGRNMMIAVDLSGSMQIPDMQWNGQQVSRVTAVRHLLGHFVNHRKGDRLGLILFADHAYLQTPLTFDTTTVHQFVEQMRQGLVGNQTAIGEAIGLATKELMKLPAKQRVLILMTDGQNTSGTIQPLAATRIAKANHVVIYTIGLGSTSFTQQTIFGPQTVNPSQDLDITLLKRIAKMTGGEFFRASNSQTLKSIYQQLDKLVPIKGPKQYYRPPHELYFWPLAFALLILFIMPLGSLRPRRIS
ncbi:MAG: hypothetical protein CENE_03581 [Candidatus Celerinatantimonas neptuna]|nr:MAG: hypothetical protein CENE_03581 [Candidatus Celerinatantimonas neptuna]